VIQLRTFIEDKEILMLVDSGSSASFINEHLAASMQGITPLPKPCKVKVADGTQHHCSEYIPQCPWSVQEHQFTTDMKILALGSFDAILGMDWLERHNPDIDWVKKTLKIKQPKGDILLQGHRSCDTHCIAISASELAGICRQGSASHLIQVYALDGEIHTAELTPHEVQTILDQFPKVFATPVGLPPTRPATIAFL
jgi:hypothetical protein